MALSRRAYKLQARKTMLPLPPLILHLRADMSRHNTKKAVTRNIYFYKDRKGESMNDQANASILNEEQLGEVSGGSFRAPSGPPPMQGMMCGFYNLQDLDNSPRQVFVENGVEVTRIKCQQTDFCAECKCKGKQSCANGWHWFPLPCS